MKWPWSNGKSRTEQLIDLLREERAANADLQRQMIETMGRQAAFMERYLGLFEHAPEPQVRVMTDADEARYENERLAVLGTINGLGATVDDFDPASWAADLDALKREIN